MDIWIRRGLVVLAGVVVLVLKQYGTAGTIDLQALAMHVAAEIDKLLVGAAAGWLMLDKPRFMRPLEERQELDV